MGNYILSWVHMVSIAIANAVVRKAWYGRHRELRAHQGSAAATISSNTEETMKRVLLVSLFIFCWISYPAVIRGAEIKVGDSIGKVFSILGNPDGRMQVGKKEYLLYGKERVVIENGKVIQTTIRPKKKSAKTKTTTSATRKVSQDARSFDDINIDNVPVAPFLNEVRNSIDITEHPTYRNMPRYKDNYRHVVDPFYLKRERGDAPSYEFRQFTTSRNMRDILNWYKRKASPKASEKGEAFAQGGGWFSNGPFDNLAMNFGVNNARNFIVITTMRTAGDDTVTVYIFHYRTAPPPAKAPPPSPGVPLKIGMLVEVKQGRTWFGGKIRKIDRSRDQPYYVEFTNYVGYYQWVDRESIRPRSK
jgi:hypothetical protein